MAKKKQAKKTKKPVSRVKDYKPARSKKSRKTTGARKPPAAPPADSPVAVAPATKLAGELVAGVYDVQIARNEGAPNTFSVRYTVAESGAKHDVGLDATTIAEAVREVGNMFCSADDVPYPECLITIID